MKYVEMILSIDDANIIQFPSLLDRVVKWKEQGIKFIRMVTDAIRPSEVIHLSGTSNNQQVSTKLTFNDIYDAIKQPTEQNFTILKNHLFENYFLAEKNNYFLLLIIALIYYDLKNFNFFA